MAGATDWHVLLAHLSVMWRAAKPEYSASVRELAEMVVMDKKSVHSSNRRMQRREVLVMK